MTETLLFSCGVGISFVFLAGAYVYLREKSTYAIQHVQLIPIRARPPQRDPRAVHTTIRRP